MTYLPPRDNLLNSGIALTKNAVAFDALIDRLLNRPGYFSGLAVVYGPSGFGKTLAATYAANVHRAYYVECGESWNRKWFLQVLLTELGQDTKGCIPALVDRVIRAQMNDPRPLIIDECDHAVKKGYLETIREIHDKSGAPIVLIGEEFFPGKIAKFSERVHNRISEWLGARACDLEDARLLVPFYCPDVDLADDLLAKIVTVCRGCTRRVRNNLALVAKEAARAGLEALDLATWGDAPFYTGDVPPGRSF